MAALSIQIEESHFHLGSLVSRGLSVKDCELFFWEK
jgi:hypothetical protein